MNLSEYAAVSRRAACEVGAAGGDGVVSVKPDTCALHLRVHSTAKTASEARAGALLDAGMQAGATSVHGLI